MRKATVFGVLILGATPSVVGAYEIRARWVERIGTANVVIPSVNGVQTIVVEPGSTHQYRVQFGVFDDDAGPAPEGGFLGWNVGRIDFTGGTTIQAQQVRLSPFTFALGGNGAIIDNDVRGIDATQGFQNGFWDFDFETMMPGPPPQPTVYGLNTFVQVYRVSSLAETSDYSVTAIGNEVVGDRWVIIGDPPDESHPHAAVTFVPQAVVPPTPFTYRLDILVPGPGAAAVLGVGGLAGFRRRTRIPAARSDVRIDQAVPVRLDPALRSGSPLRLSCERRRRMHKAALLGVVVLGAMPSVVGAYEIRARWVERVGTANVVIPTIDGVQTIVVEPGSTHQYRVQFGVFDDDAGPAPEGGFLGWNLCRLDFTGGTTIPGSQVRLAPFTFSPSGNGTLIDNDIRGFDCTQGFQNAFWDFDFETMMPGPPPQPTLTGLNTFVQVYRVSSVAGTSDYSVTAIGNEVVSDRWIIIGDPPDESHPHAAVTLAPQAIIPPTPFTHRLDILVPGPGAAGAVGVGGLALLRRRTRVPRAGSAGAVTVGLDQCHPRSREGDR